MVNVRMLKEDVAAISKDGCIILIGHLDGVLVIAHKTDEDFDIIDTISVFDTKSRFYYEIGRLAGEMESDTLCMKPMDYGHRELYVVHYMKDVYMECGEVV